MAEIRKFKKRSKIKQFLNKHIFYEKFPIREEKGISYFDNGYFFNRNTRENNIPCRKKNKHYIKFIGGKYANISQILRFYRGLDEYVD